MKISYIKSAFLSFAAVGMLASCSNDSEPVMNPDTEFEGIILNVPTRSSGTRADDPVSETEGKIHKLVVLAYKQDSQNNAPVAIPITINGTDFPNNNFTPEGYNGKYQSVPVKLAEGNYKIYVLANLDYSDLKISGTTATAFTLTEAQLKSATLEFTPSSTVPTAGLPMSCAHTSLKTSATATSGLADAYNIEIKRGESNVIYADLKIAVAKVRVSVLNNTTPSLVMNTESALDLTDFTKTVGLYDKATDVTLLSGDNKVGLTGGKYYKYPQVLKENSETEYEDAKGESWAPEDLTEETTTGGKYAWQGTWYIPEHLFASNTTANADKISTLLVNFNYSASNQITPVNGSTQNADKTWNYTTATGVVRGNFYDHVYHVSEKKITLQVRVKPWGYSKSQIDLLDL